MNADTTQFPNFTDMLIEQAPDAIVFADNAGIIRIWNAAAKKIFGFTASEAIGANLNIIIPERFREVHWRGFERALTNHTTKYAGQVLPTRALCSDGSQIYVELSFAIVLGPSNVREPYVKNIKGYKKLYEIRAKGRDGIARVFYFTWQAQKIVLLHGFMRKQ